MDQSRPASSPSSPATSPLPIAVGDLVERRTEDGEWQNGWRVSDLVNPSTGPRARIVLAAGGGDWRNVAVTDLRPCSTSPSDARQARAPDPWAA